MACLCSNAEFKPEDLDKPVMERELVGDATEQGILKCYVSPPHGEQGAQAGHERRPGDCLLKVL